MSRALNCNKTPEALNLMAQGMADDRSLVMIAVKPDPQNAGRCQLVMPDCDLANGGMTVTVWAPGYHLFSVRAVIPMPGQAQEGPSLELEPSDLPFPDRLTAITIRTHFQGLWVESAAFSPAYRAQYGASALPYYGAAYIDFAHAGDADQILDQLAAVDDSHVMIYLRSGGNGYNQPNQPYGDNQIVPAFQAWDHMDETLAHTDHAIGRGFLPLFMVYAEGADGLQWVKDNFVSLVQQLGDRIKRGPIVMAWDSVWPGSWSVEDMKEMIPWMRSVLGPDGMLGIMFSGGTKESIYLWVENSTDYRQPWMDGLDIVALTDGPGEADGVSLANKAGYMIRNPDFSQFQPDQPTHFILEDCSRGPRVCLLLEWLFYQCDRDPQQVYKPSVDAGRDRMIQMGWSAWG